jgi:hypothetical protein
VDVHQEMANPKLFDNTWSFVCQLIALLAITNMKNYI